MKLLDFEERLSDSPYIEWVWRNHTERDGTFTSIAQSRFMICIWKLDGETHITLRGPESKPSQAYAPMGGEFLGIVFKLGVFMPRFPVPTLIDGSITLPKSQRSSFWLNSDVWQFPTYDNAEVFIHRLIRAGVLLREPVVDAVLNNHPLDVSQRTLQRRFAAATGITSGEACQIERARLATNLLRHGVPINDVVSLAGYADQPHLTRSFRRWIGRTPAQVLHADHTDSEELSFLFKTPPLY